jgi:REP element-mobilizing transposase RayT
MRRARVKLDGEAYYHVMSRCALQEHLLTGEVKGMFLTMLRRAEKFSGVKVLDYCIMDNHFHLLVKVPKRREVPDDELEERIQILYGERKAERMRGRWKLLREGGAGIAVERERAALRLRMYDLSEFMKTFKQRFSLWYCSNHGNLEGTIWQGPFHSVVVEGSHDALGAVSTYIALNPVRAGLVADPGKYSWSGYGAASKGDAEAKAALLARNGGRRPEAEKWAACKDRTEAAAARVVAAKRAEAAKSAGKGGASATAAGRTGLSATGEEFGLLLRDRDVSRGAAFGSEKFVGTIINGTSRTETIRTSARRFCVGEGGATLFCAGRQRA